MASRKEIDATAVVICTHCENPLEPYRWVDAWPGNGRQCECATPAPMAVHEDARFHFVRES